MHPRRAHLDRHAPRGIRVHATANSIARLEHDDGGPSSGEVASGGQSCDASTDDDDQGSTILVDEGASSSLSRTECPLHRGRK